ncbi:ABC transporter ATP-binding protein [Staphylococcus sp. EG-SA-6]|jgi:ABC-2 type transport system ATP-binding protein|uniref:ABC transporter ATP-binding protein n=4 Tax=Staphylococcus haemolyticus TaxID=1283 RepID=A0A2A1KB81_STAHA|nr:MULTISPECIES: ABC transporter ATP-binding protein [Staphylococcus]KDP56020.1 ABC transporter, ATP-binding protein [Staphylococcus aureus subsp. aureus CO-98]MBN4935084.1 ABC transporter ATP-binding protein [Staphylococcus sp. EG-SA-6]MDU2098013.1 ABC transporter ATP-binding protein [Staphylococcus sp.]AKC75776.1 ABC superfamily ATP binding cassette transporter, ABC protein [Staphylococcus haemolyticus]AMW23807.1 sodium ABC transporter ATP-binding protein [Staphylococcus haemolyticus]
MNVIEVKDVSFQSSAFSINNLSFSIPQGFVTGFIGANGAGKTTIIRMIMDIIEPKQGHISIFGEKIANKPKWIKNKIGFVYSEVYFNQQWTAKKLEKMVSPFYTDWDSQAFKNYLEKFNLPFDEKIKHFSTGMKMKLSLALALSHHAELFILDEPTAGLDPIVRNEVLEILQSELLDEHKTLFISTHIISDLEKIADYLVHIKDGEVIMQGFRHQLQEQYSIVQGDNQDLDEELNRLFLYKEVKSTGFVGFTKQAQVFKELFGKKVNIKQPTIEELMIYIEKSKSNDNQIDFQQSRLIK